MRILVTGTAGFIGNALALRLLERGDEVAGLDNVNSYYDPALKEARLARLKAFPGFEEARVSLEDSGRVVALFEGFRPQRVAHLAAQPGVRYSIENPRVYIDSNVVGFLNVLDGCRQGRVEHLVFASSSSVYGANSRMPYSVGDTVDHPLNMYAATKKANELMAHAYSHLHGIPTTGLRFFTVYGPWGRPDMALFKFTESILSGKPIQVFNHGNMKRDLTYIDDIVEGVVRVIDRIPAPDPRWDRENPDPASSMAPYRLYNIGNNQPVALTRMIEALEERLGKTAEKEMLPHQPGEMTETYADLDDLEKDFGFRPCTALETGIDRFVSWYEEYYGVR
jgi:UDP-glucuronate 4-epimerase